ncbi:helix-turn-helix domain-containing protein [Nocardia sp. CDC159]|uniref:Helix-turn-helix domain-containing protein n=1 Tax=Nocardia pulmonis TaxID=2951408 RepID=A0A9X2E1F4_9NOCA|nr:MULTISPECIES: helix-turn-helix domain-containing protein [Nocardia]MCM6772424.1 helix-turn-helix domain-containing protein [Nocardia pulmonis]MCM6784918.1 helix-turn-helix domain-containing protein [Nocardia sp. CDC159]
MDRPPSTRLTDPRALRAYAHPTRLALVALLRRRGPLTATQAAEAIGESVASCSFHLRQLAKYGLVEEAGGGRGREKPWRASAMFTSWEDESSDPVAAAAAEALELSVAERYFELTTRWIRDRAGEEAQWREAAWFGDTVLHLTAAELRELGARMDELVRPFLDRLEDGTARPAGSRPVTVLRVAFPVDRAEDAGNRS